MSYAPKWEQARERERERKKKDCKSVVKTMFTSHATSELISICDN
jgi:hypothetical protein